MNTTVTINLNNNPYQIGEDESLIVIDGVTYHVLQQAYISGSGETYQASAIRLGEDRDLGPTCQILWDVVCTDSDDESNACDWSEPYLA